MSDAQRARRPLWREAHSTHGEPHATTSSYLHGLLRERPLFLSHRARLITELIAAASILTVLFVYFRPSLLFLETTTTGGDTGAHVYSPWFLREHLLPQGQITGWSHDWYAGFPFLHFYFPLVILIQAVLGYVIPEEIAFKIGTVLGTFFLPVAFYLFFRLLRLRWPAPIAAALGAMAFLFMDSFTIYGGNIPSSLAGEYSFSLSVGLCFVFYGLAYRLAVDERARPVLAALVLAAAALSHLVPVIIVALVAPLFLWWSVRKRGVAATARRFGIVFTTGFALTAFWAIPFVARLGYTANMKWGGVEGIAILIPRELWTYLGLAIVGAVVGWIRRDARVLLLVVPGLLSVLLFLFLPEGHIWNGRFVPFWYLTVYACAAYGVGAVVPAIARSLWRKRTEALSLGLTALAVAGVCGWILWDKKTTFIDYWIEYNYEGYEGKPDYEIFRDLNAALAGLPDGRVMWEPGDDLGRFGTPISLMSLPYFAQQPTMEGIYFESSITTPFHFIMASEVAEAPSNPIRDLPYNEFDLDRGIDHMELFDVSYFVAFSDKAVKAAADTERLEEVAVVDDFHIYEVANEGHVVIPQNEPVVYAGDDWYEAVTNWFSSGDLTVPLMFDGPDAWVRASDAAGLPETQVGDAAPVSSRVDGNTIRFETEALGEPHWIKTSYFPNWKVEGAHGPYRGAPSLMMVIPTRSEVTLTYTRTWAEWLGLILTAAALLVLLVPLTRRRLTELAHR